MQRYYFYHKTIQDKKDIFRHRIFTTKARGSGNQYRATGIHSEARSIYLNPSFNCMMAFSASPPNSFNRLTKRLPIMAPDE